MSNEHKTQEALLQAIDIMINQKLRNLGFNYYVDGVIKKDNGDGTYNVLINGTTYNSVPAKNNFAYSVSDVVQVLIKNGNWNKKIIDDKIGHDSVPQNISKLETDILNLKTRIRIYGNSNLNNYKTVGGYAIYGNSDAETISNMPCKMAGILDVYSSNGEKIDDSSSYVYLIQEYTVLDATKRYYRHISKSGSNANWVYGKWFEVLTTNITQDYIVEQKTDGIWTYRKWNSGIAECWGVDTKTNVEVKHGWGTAYSGNYPLYYSNSWSVSLPTNLFVTTETPIFSVSLFGSGTTSGTMLETHSLGSYAESPAMCLARPTIATIATVNTSIIAKGKWK